MNKVATGLLTKVTACTIVQRRGEQTFLSVLVNRCLVSVLTVQSWMMSVLKWKPTSPDELGEAESKILSREY